MARSKRRLMSDINVTPFVDVMLVLLIIFMVTAPMMTRGLDVKLPQATARPLPQKSIPINIVIDAKGQTFLNGVRVDLGLLEEKLMSMKQQVSQPRVLLRADRRVPYGLVAKVISVVKGAGIQKLGLVTRPVSHKD